MFFLNGAEGVLFGASPETAVKVRGAAAPGAHPAHRRDPAAGPSTPTARLDLDLDSRLEAELRLNEKELAEHMMLVDLARNDVARVSEPGTRRVDALLQVERYSHVMHLVSEVSGRAAGRPRRPARLRGHHEHGHPGRRAQGACGAAAARDGAAAARAVRRGGGLSDRRWPDGHRHRHPLGRGPATAGPMCAPGAGVVYDSDPMAEAEETRRKARPCWMRCARRLAAERTAAARRRRRERPVQRAADRQLRFVHLQPGGRVAPRRRAWWTCGATTSPPTGAGDRPGPCRRRGSIVLSPGPGRPADAGCCVQLVQLAAGKVPLFGVCLGLQAIVEALGGKVDRRARSCTASRCSIEHTGSGIFAGLPAPLQVGRYHSLVAAEVPESLQVDCAATAIWSWRWRTGSRRWLGVQFHPESILTPQGGQLLAACDGLGRGRWHDTRVIDA